MARTQADAGSFAVEEEQGWSPEAVLQPKEDAAKILETQCVQSPSTLAVKRESMVIQPVTIGNWAFAVELIKSARPIRTSSSPTDDGNGTKSSYLGDSPGGLRTVVHLLTHSTTQRR